MVAALRYAYKFVAVDGTTTYTFPLTMYEYTPEQGYRQTLLTIAGADYPYDAQGQSAWPLDAGQENIRFLLARDTPTALSAAYDTLLTTLRETGRGKLYTIDASGNERWCYAKLAQRPGFISSVSMRQYTPVTLRFVRLSDWFGTTETTGSQALDASPKTFTISNPGNKRVRAMTLTLLSVSAAGWSNPSLQNVSLGMTISSTRDAASANSRLKIEPHIGRVQYSNDAGGTYADDYSLVTLPAGQVSLMDLQPGDNSMSYTSDGTPNGTLQWAFYPAYQ